MSKHLLRIQSVSKRYEKHLAVDRVSLNIPRGKIFGLLGPNGAGKTTLIRMITRILVPDEGVIYFDEEESSPKHIRRIGYMPEERGLYKKDKVKEQIIYLLQLKGLPKAEAKTLALEWLERLGLKEWANRKVADLSKGMQQKVQFITTVAHKPDLLILDEPFSGLDPINTNVIESEILRLKEEGTTFIFSTHRMEQVEELCDHIGLINKGRCILEGDINDIRKQFQKQLYRVEFIGDKELIRDVKEADVEELTDKFAMLRLRNGEGSKALMQELAMSPLEILKFELHLPRLQEIFIESVGASEKGELTEPTS